MTLRTPTGRSRSLPGLAVAVAILWGCATVNDAFQRGEELAAARDWEGSIAQYRKAARAEPANLAIRAALTRATALAVADLIRRAGELRLEQPGQARDLYVRALLLEPRNERALAGLRALDAADRLEMLYREAARAQAAGRTQDARQLLRQLLDGMPDHARGRALLRSMDEATQRTKAVETLTAALQRPVTLEFREVSLRTVFDMLAKAGGVNVLFERDLRQDMKVSIFVRDTPFDQALDQLLMANGLARKVLNANTLLVYPAQKQREYQDQVVRNFFLANADARQLGNLLRTVLRTRDLYVDERRNLLVLRDTPNVVAMATKLVAAHDQPEPEVMLEVEILEVKHSVLDELGLKLPDQISFGIASPSTLDAVRGANGSTIQVTGLDKALILNLKHQIGTTNLLANPRIRVRNKEKAKVHIGDKVPVISSTISTVAALTTESISYLDVGIKLEVEPSIQGVDVVIKVSLEVSSVTNTVKTGNGSTAFQLGTRNASTTLTLRDGETQVLAGLIQRSERGNSSRLPGLGDLPVLGRLFASDALDGDRTEVLLSITPRIARNVELPADDLIEFNVGVDSGSAPVAMQPAATRIPQEGEAPGAPPAVRNSPPGMFEPTPPGSQGPSASPSSASPPIPDQPGSVAR